MTNLNLAQKTMFASNGLVEHLLRGVVGMCALSAALAVSADRPWSHGGPRCESAAPAALRLAHLRPIQQLLSRGLSEPVSVRGLAVHWTRLSVPQDSAWLAIGQADLGRRPLVV